MVLVSRQRLDVGGGWESAICRLLLDGGSPLTALPLPTKFRVSMERLGREELDVNLKTVLSPIDSASVQTRFAERNPAYLRNSTNMHKLAVYFDGYVVEYSQLFTGPNLDHVELMPESGSPCGRSLRVRKIIGDGTEDQTLWISRSKLFRYDFFNLHWADLSVLPPVALQSLPSVNQIVKFLVVNPIFAALELTDQQIRRSKSNGKYTLSIALPNQTTAGISFEGPMSKLLETAETAIEFWITDLAGNRSSVGLSPNLISQDVATLWRRQSLGAEHAAGHNETFEELWKSARGTQRHLADPSPGATL